MRALFEERGLVIAEDVPIEEGCAHVTLDGWDSSKRVGYEYITREAGDDLEFTAKAIAELEEKMQKGELYVFLADETHEVDRKALEAAAHAFLDELVSRKVLT